MARAKLIFADVDITATVPAGTRIIEISDKISSGIVYGCCEGECGTCLAKVSSLDKKHRMGGPPTEKERNLLKQLGKLTDEDISQILVDDIPPPCRRPRAVLRGVFRLRQVLWAEE